ncbi:unnamed protein product, partial [Ectocarpus fasciculatus]
PASRVARCREEFRIEEEAFLRSHAGGGAGPATAVAAAARAGAGPAMTSGGLARAMSAEGRQVGCAAGVRSAWTEGFLVEQEEAFAAAGEQVCQDLKEFRAMVEGPGAAAHEKIAVDMAAAGATEAEFLEEQAVLVEGIQQWQRW